MSAERDRTRAVIFMLLSSLSFSMMAAMVRWAGDVPTMEKVFFRNVTMGVIAFAVARMEGAPPLGHRSSRWLLLLRSAVGIFGVIGYFWSLEYLLLADATMLNRISPFFVTLFAALFLKERMTRIQIPALILAFTAALLIIKPRFDLSVLPGLVGLAGAAFAGAAYTAVRALGNRERPASIIFFFSVFGMVATGVPTVLTWVTPSPWEWAALFGIGLFAAGGQFGLTLAYKYERAAEVSIYSYTHLVFAALVGFAAWGEVPDLLSLLGMALIIAVGYMVWQVRRIQARPGRVPLK